MTLYSPGGLNLADTTAPLILAYDDSGTKDVVFAVSSSGDLTITPDGGDVTIAGALTVDGATIITVDNARIGPNTADASDNESLFLSGGGAAAVSRGALIALRGNEDGGTGKLVLTAGNVSGGVVQIGTNNNNSPFDVTIDDYVMYIGDDANAKMARGLTINQGANDDEILAFKSSDVTHGVTTPTETDTFATFTKQVAATGGLRIVGYSAASIGLSLRGVAVTDITDKDTSADGYVTILAQKKSGTNPSAAGADANLMVIANSGATRFIFDAEGSAHADVEWTTFDEHNDLQVIEDMETLLAPGRVQRLFGEAVTYDAAFFEREGLVHDIRHENGRTRGMVNFSRLAMVNTGLIRQVGGRLIAVESREERLELCVRHLVDVNPTLEGRTEALALLEAA